MKQYDFVIVCAAMIIVWAIGMIQGMIIGLGRKNSPKTASKVLAEESKRVRELLNGRKKVQVLGI